MNPKHSLKAGIDYCRNQLINCSLIREVKSWQGIEVPAPMRECFEVSFRAPIPYGLAELIDNVKPNLTWAEQQFAERIGGIPLNPGESYKNWPYYARDNEMRNGDGKFTHTYMERFWPKYANGGNESREPGRYIHRGIRYEYGDLNDVIELLRKDPYTRHAYLPIFFPEDTGKEHRIPCTLGYLFYRVGDYLHTTYYIRSCDYLRHLRDDIYLACRLNYHVIFKLNEMASKYNKNDILVPGYFTFHCANLHVFANEIKILENESASENRALFADSKDNRGEIDMSEREGGSNNY